MHVLNHTADIDVGIYPFLTCLMCLASCSYSGDPDLKMLLHSLAGSSFSEEDWIGEKRESRKLANKADGKERMGTWKRRLALGLKLL